MLKKLIEFLRENRSRVVREVELVQQVYDPTYGSYTRTETIEVVDFDALLNAIDDFSDEFKEQK